MSRNMSVVPTGPTMGSGRWAGDYLGRDTLIPGGAKIDASQFRAVDAVFVDVGAAGAAQNATTVPVVALTGPIPSGTILYFSGTKVAVLTAAAAAGATSLTVAALPTALVDADTTWYNGTGVKFIPSGTPVGRTIAERDANTGYGPALDTDDEIFLLAFDVLDATHIDDIELYRHNKIVYETYVPGWAGLTANVKTKLRALYTCSNGSL